MLLSLMLERDDPPPPARPTLIEVIYPPERGAIGLRGNLRPLSWEHTEKPTKIDGDRHFFVLDVPFGDVLELKLVRNDEDWASGRDYAVHSGDHLLLEPAFDAKGGRLEPKESITFEGEALDFEVHLPPSYDEQVRKRYPLLVALDGQALWTTSQDPYGTWGFDAELDKLYELAAIAEVIVVGVHTAERRLERLSPVPDPAHGGGEGERLLKTLVEGLLPHLASRYRIKAEREQTAILGSSLGGLFAFFAAWTRSDVFGKAACLSSSFWWANRFAVRLVREGGCPSPKPTLYLDSGASMSAVERDANLRDGFHHTRSMFRALTALGFSPGLDLHRLVFAGHKHDAASWAARVWLPMQMLFPADRQTPPPADFSRALAR